MGEDNNIFYPGYNPAAYYPGKVLYRRGGIVKMPNMSGADLSGLGYGLQMFEARFNAIGDVIGWPGKMYTENFTGAFRSVYDIDSADAERLQIRTTEEQRENFAGAKGLTFDWYKAVTQPLTYPGEFVHDALASVVDWQDFEQIARKAMVMAALSDNAGPAYLGKNAAVNAISYRLGMTIPVTASRNALSMDGLTVEKAVNYTDSGGRTYRIVAESNPYASVRNSIANAYTSIYSVKGREGAYDGMIKSVGDAFTEDVEFQIRRAGSAEAFARQKLGIAATAPLTSDQKTQINAFIQKFETHKARMSLASEMEGLGKKLKDSRKALETYVMTGRSSDADAVKKAFADFDSYIQKHETNLNNLLSSPALSRAEADEIQKYIMRGHFKNLERVKKDMLDTKISQALALSPTRMQALSASNTIQSINDVDFLSSGVTGGDPLAQSSHRKMLRHINDKMGDADTFLFMEHASSKNAVGVSYATTARSMIDHFNLVREYEEAGEIYTAWKKGNLLKTFVWLRFRNHYNYLTLAYWVQKFMDRSLHGGLIIDEKKIGTEWSVLRPILFSRKNGAWELRKIFDNHIKINVSKELKNVGYNFGPSLSSIGSLSFLGGEHMEFLKSLSALITANGGNNALSNTALDGLGHILSSSSAAEFEQRFLEFISANRLTPSFELDKIDEQVKKISSQFIKFKAWLGDKNNGLGLEARLLNDPKFLTGFAVAVHKYNVRMSEFGAGITRRYMGLLEKVGLNLNIGQAALIKSFSFVLNPTAAIKIAVTERLLGMLSKLGKVAVNKLYDIVAGLLGGASGGTGTAILEALKPLFTKVIFPILKKVAFIGLRAFVDNVLRPVTKLMSFNLGGFFKDVGKSIDASINSAVKVLVAISAGIAVIPFLIVILPIMFFTTILSPVNPSLQGGGGANDDYAAAGSVCNAPPIAANNCFFPLERISTPVYNPSGETGGPGGGAGGSGHGSNNYWNNIPTSTAGDCAFGVPTGFVTGDGREILGPTTSLGPNNICNAQPNVSGDYGKAIDIRTSQAGSCKSVFIPEFDGVERWDVSRIFTSTTAGKGVLLTGSNANDVNYRLVLLHLGGVSRGGSDGLEPGEEVASLFNWGDNTHLHVEISRQEGDGAWVVLSPSEYFCR